jgi:hypothetical protein
MLHLTGAHFISGALLLYTVLMAPVQMFVWEFDEIECNIFPTLYFDMFVDIFFMVKYSCSFRCINFFQTPHIIFPCKNDLSFDLSCYWQVEIVLQFLTGYVDISETYCDDFRSIGAKYLSSPSGFCFDFVTSLPWSFNDYFTYKVLCNCFFFCSHSVFLKPSYVNSHACWAWTEQSEIFKTGSTLFHLFECLTVLDWGQLQIYEFSLNPICSFRLA